MSSTAAGNTSNSRYLDFDEYVDLKLQKTRSTIKSTDILVALAGVAAMFLGYLLVFVVFDQWVVPGGFGIGLRWVLLSTLLILTAAWLVWKVGVPYLRSVNRLFAAKEIEKADPDLKSNLLNLVDLRSSGRPVDPAILRALEKNAAVGLQKVDVAQAIDHRPLMRMAYVLLAVVVLFCLYALFSPKKISNSIWRSLMPASNVGVSTRTEIVNVQPGDQTVLAGVKIPVSADIAGEVPERVWLHFTTADGKFRDEPVELRTDGEGPTRFKGILLGENGLGVLQDLRYVIRAGDAVSSEYHITVKQPPSANVDRVAMQFPAYMKLEPTDQVGGQIEAWEGTKITLTAHTNIPVKQGRIEFLDTPDSPPKGEEVGMTVSTDGRQLTATWTLEFRSDESYAKAYQIQCKTESGEQDPNPIKYGLTIRKDMPPEVSLLEPVRDLEAPANTIAIPLLIEAHDPDFELSHINLHVKKNGQVVYKEPLSEGRQQRVLLKPDLKLERFALKPGDLIEFWVQAFDNKQPRPNSKVTPELKVKIVDPLSEKEIRQKAEEDKANREQRLKDAEQDKNPDSLPDQPQQAAGKQEERQPRDPKQEQQPAQDPKQDDKRDDPKGQEGQGGKPKSAPGQGGQNGEKKQQGQANQPDKGQPQDQPLNNEGDDDLKALERILKFNQEQNAKKQDQPQQEQGADSKPNDSGTGNNSKTNKPSTESSPDSTGNDGTKPPKTKTEGNQNKSDPPADQTDKTNKNNPMPKAGSDESDQPMPGTGEQKNKQPGADPKPNSEAGNSDKTSTEKPMDKGNRPDSSSGTTAKPGDSSKQEDTAKQDGSKPGDNSKADSPKSDGTDKGNPGATSKPEPNGDQPKTGDKPEQDPGAQGSEATQDKNKPPKGGESQKKDGSGNGTSSDSNSPMNEPKSSGSGDEKKGNTTDGPQKQVGDSPNAEQKQADGTETGTAQPDRGPGPKPTRSENQDLKRDPTTKPETRPGEGRPNEPNNPAKSDSNNEVKNPKPTGGGPEKQKIDQQTGEKSPVGNKQEKRDGDPNAANEPKKGEGEKDQRSNQGSGGEGGSSKQDKEGNPGSRNSGEGDKTDRPGAQQSAEKQSNQAGGKKEAGQGSKANGGEKKQGSEGSQQGSEGGQSEQGGKQGQGQQPGKTGQPGGEGGQAGGEAGQGGKPGKATGQGRPGQGSAGQQGNDAPGGIGQGGPDNNRDGTSADGAPAADDGDEANLEYKKQATELVLKRLQDGLERGDVDPKLLEKLGWTEDEMRRFADRLNKHMQESKSGDNTPESVARRQQFEEMLKSLDLNRQGTVRKGTDAPQREVEQITDRQKNVPKEYRSAGEKFSREITRQRNKPAK